MLKRLNNKMRYFMAIISQLLYEKMYFLKYFLELIRIFLPSRYISTQFSSQMGPKDATGVLHP